MHDDELQKEIGLLTPAGASDMSVPKAGPYSDSADGNAAYVDAGCAYCHVYATDLPTVSPAADTELADHAAREMTKLLRSRSRRFSTPHVPLIVPTPVVALLSFDNARVVPVPNGLVYSGRSPVTWLTLFERYWFDELLEVQGAVFSALRERRDVHVRTEVTPAESETGTATVDAGLAVRSDGLGVFVRGEIEIKPGQDPFQTGEQWIRYLTVKVSWEGRVLADLPDLPVPSGSIVMQVRSDPALSGLFRSRVVPHVRGRLSRLHKTA